MSSFHAQQQYFVTQHRQGCNRSLQKKMQYCLRLNLRNQPILAFSIKLVSLPELLQRYFTLYLVQIDFVNWQCKALFFNQRQQRTEIGFILQHNIVCLILFLKKFYQVKKESSKSCIIFMVRTAFNRIMNCYFIIGFQKQSSSGALQNHVCYKKLLCMQF